MDDWDAVMLGGDCALRSCTTIVQVSPMEQSAEGNALRVISDGDRGSMLTLQDKCAEVLSQV